MAENGQDNSEVLKNTAGFRPSSARDDREARIRTLKERQNEERQKKLEEIKAQALAAQRFKEQKEFERRQRLEELRVKEDARRAQVEERKKAINDAERDRLESILKRNQEREARIEAKKRNERSSMVFAFGSSTPRMLDPTDSNGSFWGHRRATSTQNITCSTVSLTRRQSERELDGGSKKRATSAGGLERSGEGGSTPQTPAGCASGYVGRRRTDLMPTIPARESAHATPRKPFTRSPASSRPSSSLSQQSTSSVTSSVTMRNRPAITPRRPRPISIAVTGVTHDLRTAPTANDKKTEKPPLPKARKSSLTNSRTLEKKKKPPVSPSDNKSIVSPTASNTVEAVAISISNSNKEVNKEDSVESVVLEKTESTELTTESTNIESTENQLLEIKSIGEVQVTSTTPTENISDNNINESAVSVKKVEEGECIEQTIIAATGVAENVFSEQSAKQPGESATKDENEMSSSFTKVRINTEEEAKAALAERRRLAREEAERQAEMERLRIEEENRLELERQQREEEQVRLLIEQQRAAEQERLEEAIRETQRREEEERLKREEELRQKLLKEEAEKKAREEAEKQKAELAEKLEKEEKEREARRKRVEAIMLRTRGKNFNNSSSQQSEEKLEDSKSEKINGSKSADNADNHQNGKDLNTVDNIIQVVDYIKNANTVNVDTISTDDTINSNNTWQHNNTQSDLLM